MAMEGWPVRAAVEHPALRSTLARAAAGAATTRPAKDPLAIKSTSSQAQVCLEDQQPTTKDVWDQSATNSLLDKKKII